MSKKENPTLTAARTIPLYGFFTTYESSVANDLIASGEWMCSQVTERGKYILKRIR